MDSIDADGVYFNGAGPATDWNVFIYTDSGGLPGTQIFSATNIPIVQVGTTFTANLAPAAVLSAGTYWVEIQANMTFATQGEWGWTDRTVQSNNPAAWQNPGGGLGSAPLGRQSWRSASRLRADLTRFTALTERQAAAELLRQRRQAHPAVAVITLPQLRPAQSRPATRTQGTTVMIAPRPFPFHSRPAFMGRPFLQLMLLQTVL